MVRRAAFGVKIDASALDGLVDRLAGLSAEEIGSRLVDAINEVTDDTYELARKRMLSGVNLTDAYVQNKMVVDHATSSRPSATITAFGIGTSLSHYGAMQLTEAVTWSNERITGMGKKFGSWPGWTRRTGNSDLGIAANEKSRGKSVEVIKGSRKRLGSQFSIPGKTDSEGNLLIFRRKKGSENLEVLSGPAVYQLFRVAAGVIEGDVADNLERAVADLAERQFRKVIAP